MPQAKKRNVLLPWFIGVAIVALAVLWLAYQIFSQACEAPGLAQAIVLIVLPVVYLALMYLTLKSQD